MNYTPVTRQNLGGMLVRDKIMEIIRSFRAKRKRSPTYREIMAIVGLRSTSVVGHHINVLISQERLVRDHRTLIPIEELTLEGENE